MNVKTDDENEEEKNAAICRSCKVKTYAQLQNK